MLFVFRFSFLIDFRLIFIDWHFGPRVWIDFVEFGKFSDHLSDLVDRLWSLVLCSGSILFDVARFLVSVEGD